MSPETMFILGLLSIAAMLLTTGFYVFRNISRLAWSQKYKMNAVYNVLNPVPLKPATASMDISP